MIAAHDVQQILQTVIDASFAIGMLTGVFLGMHLPSFFSWLRFSVWVRFRRLYKRWRGMGRSAHVDQ